MALALGTNSGFCPSAPVDDPAETSDQSADRSARAQRHTSPGTGYSVTEVLWWCDNATEAADFDVGIYSDNSDTDLPNVLLEVSANNAKGTDGAEWKAAALSWACLDGDYWVAFQCDDTATATFTDRYGATGRVASNTNTSALSGTTWSGGDGRIYAVCAVYEEAGGEPSGPSGKEDLLRRIVYHRRNR